MGSLADEKCRGDVEPAAESHISDPSELYIDPVEEKRLLRKLDIYLAPVMTLIFLMAYLDRSNIGNAASAGMLEDLGMSSSQLGNAVTLFYVTYVAFELPFTLVMKKVGPSRLIPILILGWSIVIVGTGFMKTPGQIYASRLLLGLFESCMFPCLALYLSMFYKPGEQALRVSYLFVSAALSGAFGGLLAYALIKMDGVGNLAGWRWIFIIEGIASIAVALAIFFLLPDSFETARFLNEHDRQLMRTRAEMNARYNGAPEFDWGEVKKAVTDPKLYISCWSQFWGDICSFGFSSFLPLIIKTFGYDTVTTQLLTIPVFIWASVCYLIISFFSDKTKQRVAYMIPAGIVTAVGYALNVGLPMNSTGALYFSTFLIGPGIYIIIGLNCTWLLNSHAGYHKRATAVAMNQSFGNSAGVVVGQIFKQKVGGKYLLGLSFSLGSVLLAASGHAALYFFLKRENRKRETMSPEERKYEIEHGKGGDFHPDYRYAL